MVLITMVSFVALAAGTYRLGRVCFTPFVGALAAFLVLTRFDFPLARGTRLHRHPVHGGDRLGGRAGGRAAAARHGRVPVARRGRADAARKPGCCRASTSSG